MASPHTLIFVDIPSDDTEACAAFYRDVFGCRVALRDPDNALLLTRDGFQIYLHATGRSLRPRPAPMGIQYLMWATDSFAEFKRVTARLRRHEPPGRRGAAQAR